MPYDILDTPEKNLKKIKAKLNKNGITNTYEKKGWLIVKESEAVQVKVEHTGQQYKIKPLFPSIGNPVQIIATIILWILFNYFNVPLSVVFAILLGQVISYGVNYPKIDKLKKRVLDIMHQ
ncbi:MAG TPA: hypothetical protein ENJ95_19290 [Bacteroidetes bacterium]|nr:hypothetical protein [Bacteroidota bacterium]